MGDALTDDALEGFGKIQKFLFAPDVDDLDRYGDFRHLFEFIDTPQKKSAVRETLEAFANDPPLDGAGRPKCYVKNMSGVFDEMYHYTGDIQRLRVVAGEVRLSAYSGERGWYVSTSKLSNPLDAKEALQLPSTTNSRYRFRFSTPQADSNLKLPYGDQYAGKHFEPLTRDFPDLGRGGSRQLLLENKEVTISEVFDLEQGRALTNQEVMQLLGQ